MKETKTSGHSVLATAVLTLGVGSLVPLWGLVSAILCVVLGIYELQRIENSQAPSGGKWMVSVGFFPAFIGTAYFFLVLILESYLGGRFNLTQTMILGIISILGLISGIIFTFRSPKLSMGISFFSFIFFTMLAIIIFLLFRFLKYNY